MGKVLIVLSTILIIGIIAGFKIKDNKGLIHKLKDIFIQINLMYKELFTKRGKIISEVYALFFIVTEALVVILILRTGINNILWDKSLENILKTILVMVVFIIIVHLVIGYVLLVTSEIQKFINNVKNRDLRNNLVISYFILTIYFTIFILDPSQFEGVHFVALAGLLISYILNFKSLIKIIKNPLHAKNKDEEQSLISVIVITSVVLLGMIVLNLFLATCIINQAYPGSFTNNPTNFDLFYYTIITFTTIGYGDISPVGILAKIVSMTIAFTSVMCITIFLSTILSYKEE